MPGPPAASSAAPAAAFSAGCGVVTTGTRNCSDSRWVTNGIAAPPPTVATAESEAAGIRLRCNISPSASIRPVSGSLIRFSSSARVTRMSEWYPGSSEINSVEVWADNCSFACRDWSRSRASAPTAMVPVESTPLDWPVSSSTWASSA